MASNEQQTWLLAYDIADKKRLKRVHRMVSKRCIALQFSVFAVPMSTHEMRNFLDLIEEKIDADYDDIRAYRLPSRCKSCLFGPEILPEGVYLTVNDVIDRLVPVNLFDED